MKCNNCYREHSSDCDNCDDEFSLYSPIYIFRDDYPKLYKALTEPLPIPRTGQITTERKGIFLHPIIR
jgi:hypothetical protein